MINPQKIYGTLCSQFYDATEGYASQKEIDFYVSCIEKSPGRALEAMSGSGRLLLPLLKRGYVVDGVDNSPAMLARCHERCAGFNLAPTLHEQSLENLSLPHKYTTVIIAVGSFQLIHDRHAALQALQKLRTHLAPGGNLFVDTFTPNINADPISVRVARLDPQTTIRLTTRHIFEEKAQRADSICTYEKFVDGVVQKVEQELVRVAWYTDQALHQLFLEAGLKIVATYEAQFYDAGVAKIVHAQRC